MNKKETYNLYRFHLKYNWTLYLKKDNFDGYFCESTKIAAAKDGYGQDIMFINDTLEYYIPYINK